MCVRVRGNVSCITNTILSIGLCVRARSFSISSDGEWVASESFLSAVAVGLFATTGHRGNVRDTPNACIHLRLCTRKNYYLVFQGDWMMRCARPMPSARIQGRVTFFGSIFFFSIILYLISTDRCRCRGEIIILLLVARSPWHHGTCVCVRAYEYMYVYASDISSTYCNRYEKIVLFFSSAFSSPTSSSAASLFLWLLLSTVPFYTHWHLCMVQTIDPW